MQQRATKEQARRFLLQKQGLLGAWRFHGEKGLLDYVKQAGCVQYDPVDLCGKSHELAFLARIEDFSIQMLDSLLYEKRKLIDYYDKNMSILSAEDWPYLTPIRRYWREHVQQKERIDQLAPDLFKRIHKAGFLSSQELEDLSQQVDWYWAPTRLSRAALDALYYRGDLVIHHKKRTIKSYALSRDCLPHSLLDAPCPFAGQLDEHTWQVKRRIGAVGMLPNAPSDAWLGMQGFKAEQRSAAFYRLYSDGEIVEIAVGDLPKPLYLLAEDLPLLAQSAKPFTGAKRVRFLPPLDCLLWDRKLIKQLFDFDYKWEIYTPVSQRKYAPYAIPVLYGERFAGRMEAVCDREKGLLKMIRFWPEKDLRITPAFTSQFSQAAQRLCAFQKAQGVVWSAEEKPEITPAYFCYSTVTST